MERKTPLADYVKLPKHNKNSNKRQVNDPPTEQPSSTQTSTISAAQNQFALTRFAPALHRLQSYGNTQACILDFFRDEDGITQRYSAIPVSNADLQAGKGHPVWLEEKERRVKTLTRMLQHDDYTQRRPAGCLPARAALAKYRSYGKLFGERLHASKYPSRKPTKGLMDLPGEIRNRIYRECLLLDRPIELLPTSCTDLKRSNSRALRHHQKINREIPRMLRILRTSRVIGKEASGIFYGENEFRFTGESGFFGLLGFMDAIGDANTSQLRHLTVHIHWPGRSTKRRDYAPTNNWTNRKENADTDEDNVFTRCGSEDGAQKECMRILEKAGSLERLDLVLEQQTFGVHNICDLDLDQSAFAHGPVKTKLMHLQEQGTNYPPHESQMPLRKTITVQKPVKKQGRRRGRHWQPDYEEVEETVEEYQNLEVYAEAKGWEYELVEYSTLGQYPVERITAFD